MLRSKLGFSTVITTQQVMQGPLSNPTLLLCAADTVRGNILFGQEMDLEWYTHCLRICALLPDLQILKGGDLTEIGEKVST